MNNYTTLTKDFSYRGQHFSIVTDGKFYMTVNHNYIGNDGHVTKELRYNDLHTADTMAECIQITKNDLDMEYYTAQGFSKAEAFVKIFPEVDLETAKMIFTKC